MSAPSVSSAAPGSPARGEASEQAPPESASNRSPLVAREIVCRYGERVIIPPLSLTIAPGEFFILIGPNGAGKSTTLRALAGLQRPAEGTVSLGDVDLYAMPAHHRARRIAFSPQSEVPTWPFTVSDFVALGRLPHTGWWGTPTPGDREAVQRLLERFGLTNLAERAVTSLSGGEFHRAVLARALVQEPSVLCWDEPTAHLDLSAQFEVLGLARQLARDERLTVVATMHDLNLASQWADRLGLLVEGRLIALGSPAEVLTPAILREAYHFPVSIISRTPDGRPLIGPCLGVGE